MWIICNLVFFLLVGYSFFKCSFFFLGFLYVIFVIYVIFMNYVDLFMWGIVVVSVVVGVFCGFLMMFCLYCGLFLVGLGFGFFIGVVMFFVILMFYYVIFVWMLFGVFFGLSLIFSLLMLSW